MTEISENLSDIMFIALWLTAVRTEIFSLTHMNALSAAPTFIPTFLWLLIIDKQNICSDRAGEREADCSMTVEDKLELQFKILLL